MGLGMLNLVLYPSERQKVMRTIFGPKIWGKSETIWKELCDLCF